MKHARALLLATPLFLAACSGSTPANSVSLDESLQNPLFAQRYYTDLSEQMVSLELRKDPILQKADKKSLVERTRIQATKHAEEAAARQGKGMNGSLMSPKDLTIGTVTFLDGALFFSTDFIATPGPSLHVYLTNAVDPRDVRFPDETAIDLGALKNPYGAQTYVLSKKDATRTYRTAVLWDNALGSLYGFAQLQDR